MSMRVFLTGASGYLGSVLSEHLNRAPEVESITGIALTRPSAPLPEKMTFRQMDIRSPDLALAMAGHDAVIHTACVVLWPASMPARERDDVNLNGVRNVAKAALASNVSRFIDASSMAVYDPNLVRGQTDVTEDFAMGTGTSAFYYWNGKALAERALTEMLGDKTLLTLFRPIYIMGPRNRSTVKRYRENAINFTGQDPRRQFVHEEDVASAFMLALRTDMPGPFNVVPDDYVRVSDVWNLVGAKSVRTAPLWLARMITWIRWRCFSSPVHPSWVADMTVDFTGSNARLKRAGWKPQYNSVETLRSSVARNGTLSPAGSAQEALR
jgi:UDP-glucose 4-epimerase